MGSNLVRVSRIGSQIRMRSEWNQGIRLNELRGNKEGTNKDVKRIGEE